MAIAKSKKELHVDVQVESIFIRDGVQALLHTCCTL